MISGVKKSASTQPIPRAWIRFSCTSKDLYPSYSFTDLKTPIHWIISDMKCAYSNHPDIEKKIYISIKIG